MRQLRQSLIQRDQVREAVNRYKLALRAQFIGNRDAVYQFTTLGQIAHPREDPSVLLEAEVGWRQHGSNGVEIRMVQQNRTKHKTFGVGIRWKPLLEQQFILSFHSFATLRRYVSESSYSLVVAGRGENFQRQSSRIDRRFGAYLPFCSAQRLALIARSAA